jgi:outer membrane protein assembly factor BamA
MKTALILFGILNFPQVCPAQQFPLETVTIEGGSYPQAFVLKWSGLKIGQATDNSVFSEACAKLQSTGLFRTAAYRYTPGLKSGFALVLRLEPAQDLVNAELDIPGLRDEDDLWAWLHANYPVQDRRVPENDAALSFYSRAIEEYLAMKGTADKITTRLGGGLGPGAKVTVLFQPQDLPKVGALKFEGTHNLNASDLEKRLANLAMQSDYTPAQFRLLVEENIRPVYEERGFLKVAFTIRSEKTADRVVAVTTTVTEGNTYQLAKVSLEGEGLPRDLLMKSGGFKIGRLANWKEVQAAIAAAELPLRREGYIALRAMPVRTLHDDSGTVDLSVQIQKGRQFVFGSLELSGLAPTLEAQARRLWMLPAGQPLDQEYPNTYLKNIAQLPEFSKGKGFATELKVAPESNVVDVSITFR